MLGQRLLLLFTLVPFIHPAQARAQAAESPWRGIVANDARSDLGQQYDYGSNDTWRESISGDGRFVVFHSNIASLIAGDTNNWNDVFLRDRATGALSRVSVASDGTQANHMSAYPVISRNGRHIAFHTCATNLDPADTNDRCDIYVHDREIGTTVRVNLGPNGEQGLSGNTYYFSISVDGRFVAFSGNFTNGSWTDNKAYVRDRDPDENGVFDEPGLATTTLVMENAVGTDQIYAAEAVAISGDGRFVGFAAGAADESYNALGNRMYVHDRVTLMTSRVDRPFDNQDVQAYAGGPHFSDAGHLVYSTNAPNLVPGDADPMSDDVFVFNLYTGGNVLIRLNHPNAPVLADAWVPSISADGRYVAFMGAEQTPEYALLYNAYVYDRELGLSYEVSVRPDGSRDNTIGTPWISADGTAVAFSANAFMLVDSWGNNGVFVSANFALSPAEVEVPDYGGSFQVELAVPANVAWSISPTYLAAFDGVSPSSGVGPATIQVDVSGNSTSEEKTFWFAIGSEQVRFHQPATAEIYYINPWSGPPTGGTPIEITGTGFAQGATVTFDGVPALDVVVVNGQLITATTPAHDVGWVMVELTNPNGFPVQYGYGFWYEDPTPPVITPNVSGTFGLNDWYVSDVTVQWDVHDDESPITQQYCDEVTLMSDTAQMYFGCSAWSTGGEAWNQVVIKRDATPPSIQIMSPETRVYAQGEQVQVWYACSDETSSIASCTAPAVSGGYLNTSSAGTFEFTVTAEDFAGHRTTKTVGYEVKTATAIVVPAASGPYGSAASLRATLTANGVPLAGRSMMFFVDGQPVGAATTAGLGDAVLGLALEGRNAGSYVVHVEYAGDMTTLPSTGDGVLTVEKLTPVVTWATPAFIAEGTPLGAAQLNANASVPGTFAYSPSAGTVLPAGTHSLSTTFTPSDATNYNSASKTVTLKVKAVPVITWAAPAPISYPMTVGYTQLNATANVAGSFSYNPAVGTVLPAGSHVLTATFTPSNAADYTTATATVTLDVQKGTVPINWPTPAAIEYGTPLGASQLNANTYVSGSYTYSPPAGTVLPVGTHTLSVTFAPNDPSNYESAAANVSLVVNKRYPPVWWSNPAAIVYGTPLSATQLDAYSTVPGTFTYNPPAGTVLSAGTQQLNLTFTPDDTANYHTVSYQKTIVVQQATTVLAWENPASIVYGTALSATQLNATANVAGTFTYTPAAGTVLNAGTYSLHVSFTPSDPNYAPSGKYVGLVVQKRTPAITWSNPAPIAYGTPLSWTQYNATVNVGGGGFIFDPPLGTVLNAGAGQTLRATYEPSDWSNYNAASATVAIDVLKAAPAITWNAPAPIQYGTPLGATQLNATANMAGTFEYSPGSGAVLPAGVQTLSVTFTPVDSANYEVSSRTVSLTVSQGTPVLTWAAPQPITYGAALSTAALNPSANVAGTFTYSPAAGTVLPAGTHVLSAHFVPADAANYTTADITVSLTVAKATPTVSWATPASVTYGTALSSAQLNATTGTAGTFSYAPAAGAVLGAGTHSLVVSFTPADTANYNASSASTSITVSPVALTIRTDNASKVYGAALPAFSATATGLVNGDSLASLNGVLSFATSATAASVPGGYAVTPSGVSSPNYTITFAAGTLTITKASTSLSLTTTPNPSSNLQNVQMRATVSAVAPGAGTATGNVEFRDNGVLLGTAPLVNGVATLTKKFKKGSHPLTATYAGDANFTGSSGTRAHQTN